MLGTYFYHEIIRKTVVAFGTLFNDINVRHKNSDGDSISQIKIP
ncbi:MAG: tail sheath stabilizer and completion protein, partial [Minisyncoccia bacterium]